MTKTKKTKRTQIKDLVVKQQELTGQELKTVKGGAGTPVTPVTPSPGTVNKTVDKASPKLYQG